MPSISVTKVVNRVTVSLRGPQGPPGSGGGGGAWTHEGTYSAGTTYQADDVVLYNGSSYVALRTTIGDTPGSSPLDWQLVVSKGDTGATGADGAAGADGATGATGPQGDQGEPGVQGPQGDVGPAGADGADGADGATGATGATGPGVPTGGTTGQALTKIDGTDYNTQWTTLGGGSGTVTSVALTMPSGFSVGGSPVTSSGTLAVTTSLSGVLKGTGSGFAAAVAGTDYVTPQTTLAGYGITDAQPLDVELSAIAGLVSAADKLPYFTGSGTAALADFTSAGRALVDDADAAAQRTTLGLGTLATQSGTFSGTHSGTSSGTNTGDQTITLTGDVTGSGTGSFAATIAADAVTYAKMQDISATQRIIARNTAGAGDPEEATITQVLDWLGSTRGQILYRNATAWVALSPGTAGQYLTTGGAGADPSWSMNAELAAIAGLTSAADRLPYFTGSGTASLATFTSAGRALVDDADAAAQRTTLGLDNALKTCAGMTVAGTTLPASGTAYWRAPFGGTITKATVLANASCSVTFTIKKSTYSGFPTTSSIVASAKPTLSSAQKSEDSTLSGWTTSIAAGDVLEFIFDGVTAGTPTSISLILDITKA